jgi:hypothetical protein
MLRPVYLFNETICSPPNLERKRFPRKPNFHSFEMMYFDAFCHGGKCIESTQKTILCTQAAIFGEGEALKFLMGKFTAFLKPISMPRFFSAKATNKKLAPPHVSQRS